MKRLFIPFLLLIIGPPLARAQVLLNLQLPPTGIQLKSQLWNFNITRTTAQPINVKIEMTFTDAGNGQRVMTASSGIVTLTQSLTQLQAGSLAPIAYSVVNNAYNVDMSPNGFLPIGRFDVCFAVLEVGVDASDKLAEECETIEVEPISPPILIQPVDGEQTDIGRPFFTWLPPAPVAAFNQLRYDWLLVQVVGNQTPAEAILQNMPLHAQQNLSSLSLQYPPSLPPLDTGKTYAWQVSAKSTGNAIVKSEVFMFTVKRLMDDMLARRRRTPIYVPLLRENEGVYSKVYDTIRFEYLNDGPDTLATISIQDITSAQRSILLPLGTVQRLNFGFNYLSLGVQTLEGIQDQHIYLLELVNSKKERWYLKFAYSKGNE